MVSIHRDFCASFLDAKISMSAMKGKIERLNWTDEKWDAHRKQVSDWEGATRADPVKGDERRKDKREAIREQVRNGTAKPKKPLTEEQKAVAKA